ncbi:40S ribosomal S16 [Tubulinosema ratisbonensis]|uniref:40S ribosomal S16 n=1 Tax=Tubulinosema ratisbonensis TaxID=291195 RepID=A0A437AJI9_9MICR|nr:40S ribosomal S16 [Tubulinosema ratisbonensis]
MAAQIVGKKKTSFAVANCSKSNAFEIKINNRPLNMIESTLLQSKFNDVITIIGLQRLTNLNFDIKVRGGGHISQIYAARQAFCKALIDYYGQIMNEDLRQEIRNILVTNAEKNTLVADPRRQEAKKFGGPGARARYQKSYR